MGRDRILVVDDDPDNRAMIGHFLTNWGFAVDDAKNGKVALEKIKASPPALVLLDLEMPEMDGFETCERLKTNPD
ncbi:MAG TPA: response regulator, partial [Vicinamibacteria bacterium]|nr:response regulator [Vicinamibacteria bacterium]